MISGAHVIVYSKDAEADRVFVRDVLGFKYVDAASRWRQCWPLSAKASDSIGPRVEIRRSSSEGTFDYRGRGKLSSSRMSSPTIPQGECEDPGAPRKASNLRRFTANSGLLIFTAVS